MSEPVGEKNPIPHETHFWFAMHEYDCDIIYGYAEKQIRIDFLVEKTIVSVMSEDPEIERIKQRKLQEMLKQQAEKQSQPQTKPEIIELDGTNFDRVISAENPTLVDFWAEWCGPCKTMHPVFESLSKKYPKIQFARVNVDNNQNIAMKYNVQSIPTFIMFKAGLQVDQMMGAVGAPGIHMICKKYS